MTDTFTSRVAAIALAVGFLGLIGVIALLAWDNKDVPAVLAGALGLVLGGLLPSPITKQTQPPGDVNVHTTTIDPGAVGDAIADRLAVAPKQGAVKRPTRSQRGSVLGTLLYVVAVLVVVLVLIALLRAIF